MKFHPTTLTKGVAPLLMLAAVLATPAPALAQNLKPGQVDVKVIDKAAQPYIEAKGVFDAPPDKVWRALTDFPNYTRYYESVVQSEVRARQGNQAKVYVKFDFPFPINTVWVLNQYTLDNTNKRLSWKMLDGNLKDSAGDGSWTLTPYQGKTLGTYRLNLKGSGAGGWVQKQAVLSTTPAVFKHLNQQIR